MTDPPVALCHRPSRDLVLVPRRDGDVRQVAHGLAVMRHKKAVLWAIAAAFLFNGVFPLLWIWLVFGWTRAHPAAPRPRWRAWALRLLAFPTALWSILPVSGAAVLVATASDGLLAGSIVTGALLVGHGLQVVLLFGLRESVHRLLPGHVALDRLLRATAASALRATLPLVALVVAAIGLAPAAELAAGASAALVVAELVLIGLTWLALLRASAAVAREPALQNPQRLPQPVEAWAAALQERWGLRLDEAPGGLVAAGGVGGQGIRVEVELATHPAQVRIDRTLGAAAQRWPALRLEARQPSASGGVALPDPILGRLVAARGIEAGDAAALLGDQHEAVLGVLHAWPESVVRGGVVRLRASLDLADPSAPSLDALAAAALALGDALDRGAV